MSVVIGNLKLAISASSSCFQPRGVPNDILRDEGHNTTWIVTLGSSNIGTDRALFLWWSVVECGGVWWSVVECGGVWWSVVECGGVWWSVVECGGGRVRNDVTH